MATSHLCRRPSRPLTEFESGVVCESGQARAVYAGRVGTRAAPLRLGHLMRRALNYIE